MARSRRKSGGCARGRYREKKLGKGMSVGRPRLGYRPRPKPKKLVEKPGEQPVEHPGGQAG